MSNIEDTIATIELLQSMYCGDDEFSFCTTQDQDAYDRMLKAMEDGDNDKPATTESIRLQLNLPLSSDQEDISSWRLAVTCRFSSDFDIAVASSHNNWLSRDAHQALTRSLQEFECDADDQPTRVLDSIQFLQSQAEDTAVKAYLEQQNNAKNNDKDSGPVTFLREWIWFPMIYTREKVGGSFYYIYFILSYTHQQGTSEDISLIGHQAMESLDFYVRENQVHYAWRALTRLILFIMCQAVNPLY